MMFKKDRNKLPLKLRLNFFSSPDDKTDGEQRTEEGDEPEKTYTRAELDVEIEKAVKKRLKEKSAAKPKQPETEKSLEPLPDETPSPDNSAEIEAMRNELAVEKIKSAMAVAGIRPERIVRASHMISLEAVLEDGKLNDSLLKKEMEGLIKEFPELKAATGEPVKGFKIGADGSDSNEPAKAPKKPVDRIAFKTKSLFNGKDD